MQGTVLFRHHPLQQAIRQGLPTRGSWERIEKSPEKVGALFEAGRAVSPRLAPYWMVMLQIWARAAGGATHSSASNASSSSRSRGGSRATWRGPARSSGVPHGALADSALSGNCLLIGGLSPRQATLLTGGRCCSCCIRRLPAAATTPAQLLRRIGSRAAADRAWVAVHLQWHANHYHAAAPRRANPQPASVLRGRSASRGCTSTAAGPAVPKSAASRVNLASVQRTAWVQLGALRKRVSATKTRSLSSDTRKGTVRPSGSRQTVLIIVIPHVEKAGTFSRPPIGQPWYGGHPTVSGRLAMRFS
jgi:hypothetical protein